MNLIFPVFIVFAIQQCSPWNVGNYLQEVDSDILKLMENPVNKSKRKLFEAVNDYIETLQDLIEKINLKRRTALQASEVLLYHDHPLYTTKEIDDKEYREKFGWDEIDLDDIHRLMNETHAMWDEFKMAYRELRVYFSAEDKKNKDYSDY